MKMISGRTLTYEIGQFILDDIMPNRPQSAYIIAIPGGQTIDSPQTATCYIEYEEPPNVMTAQFTISGVAYIGTQHFYVTKSTTDVTYQGITICIYQFITSSNDTTVTDYDITFMITD